MRHSHRTRAQKQIDNLLESFDRFPFAGQLKIAVIFFERLLWEGKNEVRKNYWKGKTDGQTHQN